MSINVNVSGNPIRINRGKLITTDPDYDKKEFDKRRRMRLEQVRHQSKDIAENVRNKVRKEKKKQLSDFERREEDKLKQWQNRKLLELQQQYRVNLQDIGLAHAQAIIESTQDDIEEDYREQQKEKAKERGHKAGKKLKADRNQNTAKKAIPTQHKKLTRDIEDARSVMVAKNSKTPAKKRKKHRGKTNINITTNASSDSQSESEMEMLNLMSDDCGCTSDMQESGARRKRSKSRSPQARTPTDGSRISSGSRRDRSASPRKPKSVLETIPEPSPEEDIPIDTRISDRIRSRRFLIGSRKPCDVCPKQIIPEERFVLYNQAPSFAYSEKRNKPEKSTSTINSNIRTNEDPITCNSSCQCDKPSVVESKVGEDIPAKPTITLKSVAKSTKDNQQNKVQYYDHSNRFSKEYVGNKSAVQKISDEDIEACDCACLCNQTEMVKKSNKEAEIRKNDKEAEIRGKKAMDKLNVHKDYNDMLKKLPVLQKQERLATLTGDKPIFHMDNNRLNEHERNKQNAMENVYERHFPKTITIPPKKHVIEEEPFKTIDVSKSDIPGPNGAQWDENRRYEDGFTLTKDCGNIMIETDVSCANKEDYLKYLLERLKLQKEMLLREAASLPENSNLNNIISELEGMRNLDGGGAVMGGISPRTVDGGKISSRDGCPCPLPDTTSNKEDTELDDKKSGKQKRSRQPTASNSSSSTSSTPTKKRKQRTHKIILQNTSTQTSPKIPPLPDECPPDCQGRRLQKHSPKKRSQSPRRKSEKTLARHFKSRQTSPIRSSIECTNKASSPINIPLTKKTKSPTIAEDFGKCKCDSVRDIAKICKCKCHHRKKESDKQEVCEILIKIKENEDPEVRIKSPAKSDTKSDVAKPKSGIKRSVKINDNKPSEKIRTSWREQLSRNDIAGTSTSTSYFSPPDYSKSDFSRKPQAESTGTQPSYTDGSSAQKQRKKIDPRLLTYIKKLLTMSRHSIEDLGVSSVSDVSTPSASLFERTKTTPQSLNQLRSVIKYFNINPEDLAYYLSYSDEAATSGSIFDHNSTASTVNSSGYDASKSQFNNNNNNNNNSVSDQSKQQENVTPTLPIAQYANLADLCQKRISDLAAMIEKVRMEKQQILSPGVTSDKENSTQYMGLPPQLNDKSPNVELNTSSDREQAEINRRMLEIDYDLAERLKLESRRRSSPEPPVTIDDVDSDLIRRYRRLINVDEKITEDVHSTRKETLIREVELKGDQDVAQQILLNIPRLPKLEINHAEKQKRPPPAKGLSTARKFNIEINNQPHELSTIAEVDSQLSARIRQSYSPRNRGTSPFENLNPIIVLPDFPTNWVDNNKTDQIIKEKDGSMPDIVAQIDDLPKKEKPKTIGDQAKLLPNVGIPENTSNNDSSEKSDVDNIEMMLKSMGMDWAIATLRKTRAAQNQASSSTSSDLAKDTEQKSTSSFEENLKLYSSSSTTSDVTLRDILGKKLFGNSTSSSLLQSVSPNLKGINELSAILGSGRSTDNKQQRTSTPIQTTKSSDSKKDGVFTGESEVSSVKLSDEYITMKDSTGNDTDC